MPTVYDKQRRGSQGAYDRYLRGMDSSMRQKVALTAAHLLCEGKVADMGMGSGSGSFALAALYPELEVVGVDVDPQMVERAQKRHQLPNLRFVQGDIAEPCFPTGSIEAIIDSSVLHHVSSFNSYDRQAVARCLAVQVEQLCTGGVLIVRDFIDPGAQTVWLDVRSDDGHGDGANDDPLSCSTAELFERFAREFRSLLEPKLRGVSFRRVTAKSACLLPEGFVRYELRHSHAIEFVLRKDYRESWSVEIQEEYTFGTQAELEASFASLGLRVLASTPIHNPWILRNRLRDQIALWSTAGEPIDLPATNYVIVGQKVGTSEGVRLTEVADARVAGYLELSHWSNIETGRVYDLARRPGLTVDVVPWFRKHGALHLLARRSYPRPVLASRSTGSSPIDGAGVATYVTEPLIAVQQDKPLGQTAEELLCTFPDIGADAIIAFEPGTRYYPSPGGIQEQVRSVFVQIAPVNVQAPLAPSSGFSTSGLLRAIEARQLLRAAQVGGLPDARLELNTYELCRRLGVDPGEWIGEAISLSEATPEPAPEVSSLQQLARRPHRRLFRRADRDDSAGFLEHRCATFVEHDANGRELCRADRELVQPAAHSLNTVAVAVLCRHAGQICLAVQDRDLPASQCFDGNSEILVAPAWRIPQRTSGVEATRAWVRERLEQEYGLTCRQMFELGGRYHPSAGITPEVVYPLAVEVAGAGEGPKSLCWLSLPDTIAERAHLHDGHLRIILWRAAHALGLLRLDDSNADCAERALSF